MKTMEHNQEVPTLSHNTHQQHLMETQIQHKKRAIRDYRPPTDQFFIYSVREFVCVCVLSAIWGSKK